MFTGFPTENTPAIQIWDYFRTTQSGSASISLTDDCAPIQLFRTGSSSNAIAVYLPSSPIDGKQIKIVNQRYGSSTIAQVVNIYASDTSGSGNTNTLYSVGGAGVLDLIFVKNATTYGPTNGQYQSGWIALNQGSVSAVNYGSVALGSGIATFSNSTAIGRNSSGAASWAQGNGAVALGGSYASGQDSFAAAVGSNSTSYGASGSNSIALGYLCTASGSNSCVIGGGTGLSQGGIASTYAAMLGSFGGTANQGVVIGGDSGSVTQANGVAISGTGTRADRIGKFAIGAASNFTGSRSDLGHCQTSIMTLIKFTSDATPAALVSNTNAAGANNQVSLTPNSAYVFTGTVVARQQAAGGTQSAGWKIEGLIRQEVNQSTTTLVASTVTTISNVPGWGLALSANTTTGSLAITATGAAATNIRWVATVYATEVIYA